MRTIFAALLALWSCAALAAQPATPAPTTIAVSGMVEHPQALTMAGITGTNGKTTCAWLLAQALQFCGRPSAYMGTLGFGRPPTVTPNSFRVKPGLGSGT